MDMIQTSVQAGISGDTPKVSASPLQTYNMVTPTKSPAGLRSIFTAKPSD